MISCDIETPHGVVCQWWRPVRVLLDYERDRAQVVLKGWYSKKAYDEGKMPLCEITATSEELLVADCSGTIERAALAVVATVTEFKSGLFEEVK